MQNDVRITIVEKPSTLFRPWNNVEFLNVPNLQSDSLACLRPGGFSLPNLFADVFLELRDGDTVQLLRLECLEH